MVSVRGVGYPGLADGLNGCPLGFLSRAGHGLDFRPVDRDLSPFVGGGVRRNENVGLYARPSCVGSNRRARVTGRVLHHPRHTLVNELIHHHSGAPILEGPGRGQILQLHQDLLISDRSD